MKLWISALFTSNNYCTDFMFAMYITGHYRGIYLWHPSTVPRPTRLVTWSKYLHFMWNPVWSPRHHRSANSKCYCKQSLHVLPKLVSTHFRSTFLSMKAFPIMVTVKLIDIEYCCFYLNKVCQINRYYWISKMITLLLLYKDGGCLISRNLVEVSELTIFNVLVIRKHFSKIWWTGPGVEVCGPQADQYYQPQKVQQQCPVCCNWGHRGDHCHKLCPKVR